VEDGLYRIALQLDLLGELSDAVLPVADESLAADADVLPAELPASDSLLVFTPPEPYTGLIIDARGTDLKPAMAPRVVDDGGRVVYSPTHVTREYAIEFGVVGYEKDMAQAAVSERLGGRDAHPMVVPALGASGLFGGDVTVTRDAGVRILMADAESRFLTECRVVFVLGPRPQAVASAFLDTASTDSVDVFLDVLLGPGEADTLEAAGGDSGALELPAVEVEP
jgi:hypothetical protein